MKSFTHRIERKNKTEKRLRKKKIKSFKTKFSCDTDNEN